MRELMAVMMPASSCISSCPTVVHVERGVLCFTTLSVASQNISFLLYRLITRHAPARALLLRYQHFIMTTNQNSHHLAPFFAIVIIIIGVPLPLLSAFSPSSLLQTTIPRRGGVTIGNYRRRTISYPVQLHTAKEEENINTFNTTTTITETSTNETESEDNIEALDAVTTDDSSSDSLFFDDATTIDQEASSFDGDFCFLPEDYEDMTVTLEKLQRQDQKSKQLDLIINLIPVIVPIIAYINYSTVASIANEISEALASRNFVEVDGGSYRAQIIAPAINGIIIPACVVTFATLLSITISFLRQRQQEIRTTINTEAGELRVLQALVEALPPGPNRDQCKTYLIQYTSRLIAESQPTTRYDTLEATSGESEMNGFLTQLIQYDNIRADIRAESYSAVMRLNSERSVRISSLQSKFPPLHYAILTVLAMSICFCYLLETDQNVLVFLYALQLKFLWSILVGVFSGFGVVCYDLIDPFQGSYQISSTVKQLYTIRSTLVLSLEASSSCVDSNTS